MTPPVHLLAHHRATRPSEVGSVPTVRERLREFASAKGSQVRGRVSHLLEYAPDVQELRSKGFTCEEISDFLARCGVVLPADTIRTFLDELQFSRVLVLENKVALQHSTGSHGAWQRGSELEGELRKALETGDGLVLRYQPQVNSLTGEVVGAEALMRWRHNGTLIMPSDFIAMAEETDLILQAGEWVLREACREAKRWYSMGLGGRNGIRMSVNLSVKQLTPGLADIVHSVLCDTGLPARHLGLEITESAVVRTGALDVLDLLSSTGIHLSLDDFGTGYSGLSQLKDMPLDTVKIDQSFVRALGNSEVPSFVVEAIINLAKKLKMSTVAEGVETLEQATALAQMGCSICQGFYFSTPLSGAAFVEYARDAQLGTRTDAQDD